MPLGKVSTGPHMKGSFKFFLWALAIAVPGYFAVNYALDNGFIKNPNQQVASVAPVAHLQKLTETTDAPSSLEAAPMPSMAPASLDTPQINLEGWKWNAQFGLMFAIGGTNTTHGSLMEKYGVNLHFINQDDTPQMQKDQVAFATALSKGDPNPQVGAHFVTIMGDQYAGYAQAVNPVLAKLGPDYQTEEIGVIGRSDGEDALWGPPAWKRNKQAIKGGLVAASLREGDWNIGVKYVSDLNIKNNPDPTTYDPDALNWYAASDFIKAGEALITHACEDRNVIKDGKRTGSKKKVCVQGMASWTPVDKTVTSKVGGVVRIVSSHEYSSQMPCSIIGIVKWDKDNHELVKNMYHAALDGGDQVRKFPNARHKAGEVSAINYQSESGPYWERYYMGITEPDAKGVTVTLGGSKASGIADAANWFGIASGSLDNVSNTYTVFGKILTQQYPRLVPDFPPVQSVINKSFTSELYSESADVAGSSEQVAYGSSVPTGDQVVGDASYHIEFKTGQADLTPAGMHTVDQVLQNVAIAKQLAIVLHGYTDNVGSATSSGKEFNQTLSEKRAQAVKEYLQSKAPSEFPDQRFPEVVGKGDADPIASNATETGRAKNRRVEVILGQSR